MVFWAAPTVIDVSRSVRFDSRLVTLVVCPPAVAAEAETELVLLHSLIRITVAVYEQTQKSFLQYC